MMSKHKKLWARLGTAAILALTASGCVHAQTSPAAAQTRAIAADTDAAAETRWITLGTLGGPLPSATRGQPANALVRGDDAYLIDAGDGTAQQLAKAGIGLQPVRAVFLSHLHVDHTAGLGAIISLRWMTSGTGTLTIYGPKGTQELVDGLMAAMEPARAIGFGFTGAPPISSQQVRTVELADGEKISLGTMTVTVAENTHYTFEATNEPASDQAAPSHSLSYRFDTPDRSITYTGDTGPSEAVEQLARGSDMLVSEMIDFGGTMEIIRANNPNIPESVLAVLSKHLRDHHLTPQQAGEMAERAGVRQLVLTHLIGGKLMNEKTAEYRIAAAETFGGDIHVAEDLGEF